MVSCISSVSYIKPQPGISSNDACNCCISSVSYIKPQHTYCRFEGQQSCISSVSYIKPQLISRARPAHNRCISSVSYIKPQPTLKNIHGTRSCISSVSYIKPQLIRVICWLLVGCISSVSYIKPQHIIGIYSAIAVVYRPFPTSNHNTWQDGPTLKELYIVRFLHQTTTFYNPLPGCMRCISSVSYIKPQL